MSALHVHALRMAAAHKQPLSMAWVLQYAGIAPEPGSRVQGLRSRVQGPGSRGLGSRVSDLGSRVSGLGSRVSGLWPRVEGPGSRVY
eukprot:3541153-Rhodomonas_salina.1